MLPGDVIVAANGSPCGPESTCRALAHLKPGDRVKITVRRGASSTLSIRTTADRQDPKRPIIGVFADRGRRSALSVPIKFDLRKIGGPSAGLAFALELMEKKGRDVDHGYKIAATGELQLDGSVTSIGGIKQKTIGARKSHVDVFLVPAMGRTPATPSATRMASGSSL